MVFGEKVIDEPTVLAADQFLDDFLPVHFLHEHSVFPRHTAAVLIALEALGIDTQVLEDDSSCPASEEMACMRSTMTPGHYLGTRHAHHLLDHRIESGDRVGSWIVGLHPPHVGTRFGSHCVLAKLGYFVSYCLNSFRFRILQQLLKSSAIHFNSANPLKKKCSHRRTCMTRDDGCGERRFR